MSAQATAVGQPSTSAKKTRKRILTGDRPTAKSFHLGNYYGTLANRVKLQDEYDSFFLIADYHMLTTRLTELEEIGRNIRDLVIDYLSVGIDPKKTTIYLQSLIPEATELFLSFSLLVPDPRRAHPRRRDAPGDGWLGKDGEEPRQCHFPDRRSEDGREEDPGDVHRPEPHPPDRSRAGRGKPGLRLPRRLQPGQSRGRGP